MRIDKEKLNKSLHHAIIHNDNTCVRKIIRSGADVNAENVYGLPPIHSALFSYTNLDTGLDVFRTLIKHGADPNKRSKNYGKTPFYWILAQKSLYGTPSDSIFEVTQTLIKFGADVNKSVVSNSDWLPINFAVFHNNNNVDLIRLLIDSGADVNARHQDGSTPLFFDMSQNYGNDISRLLIDSGAEVNIQNQMGLTPLHIASSRYNLNMFQLLLDAGANPMIQDNNGETPFDIVTRNKHTDIGAPLYMKLMFFV